MVGPRRGVGSDVRLLAGKPAWEAVVSGHGGRDKMPVFGAITCVELERRVAAAERKDGR
jgi:hypothetical protein